MSTLLRFGDKAGQQCWSQVKMDTGETVWIGIAQTGLLIKRSRFGLFGKVLFSEQNPVAVGMTAKAISATLVSFDLPAGMSNIVLSALTQAAIESASETEFVARLNLARIQGMEEM